MSKLCLPLGCSSVENQPEIGISSRRQHWRWAAACHPACLCGTFSARSPIQALHALLHLWGTEKLTCLHFPPSRWLAGTLAKEIQQYQGKFVQKSTFRKTTSSLSSSLVEKWTPSTCQDTSTSFPQCSQLSQRQSAALYWEEIFGWTEEKMPPAKAVSEGLFPAERCSVPWLWQREPSFSRGWNGKCLMLSLSSLKFCYLLTCIRYLT